MLEFFANLVIFSLMVALIVFWLSNLLLPVLYSIPHALPLCSTGRCSWWFPASCIGTMLIWLCTPTAALVGVGYLLGKWWPSALSFLLGSWGFVLGQWLGIVGFMLSLFSRKTRADMKLDFDNSIKRYLKSS